MRREENVFDYVTKTIYQLVEEYCREHEDTDQERKAMIQTRIKEELRDRMEAMLCMMDYPECYKDPKGIVNRFEREWNK